MIKNILIIGPPRSGTTALQGVVCASFGIEFMPECNYLTDIFSLYDRVAGYPDRVRFSYYFKDKSDAARLYGDLAAEVMSFMGQSGCGPSIFKDPLLSPCFPRAAELLDNESACLALVRHPADVMASMKRVRQRAGAQWDLESDLMLVYRCFEGVRSLGKMEGDLLRLTVRYEDVVSGQAVDALSNFLGTPIDLSRTTSPDWLSKTGEFKSEGYGRAFSQENVRDGAVSLEPAELDRIQSAFSGIMAHWDYQPKA